MKFISIPNFSNKKLKISRITLVFSILLSTFLYSQQTRRTDITERYGRTGLNTTTPRATLDIREKDPAELLPGAVQGVIFPRLSTEARKQFASEQLVEGLMIYNTDKKCIELCYDFEGTLIWKCLSKVTPSKIDIINDIDTEQLIEKTFTLYYSSWEFNMPSNFPQTSWNEKIVKKTVTIGNQTETLVLTIPAGSSASGNIYLENTQLKTESGNPLDLSSIGNEEIFVTFELFLDDDNDIFLKADFRKYIL